MEEFILSGVLASIIIVLCCLLIYELLRYVWNQLPKLTLHPHLRVLVVVFAAFIGNIANMWIFALVYFLLSRNGYGTLSGTDIIAGKSVVDFLTCLYFSAATYSTLGLGDVTPQGALRMVTVAEALTGFILMGWTVSFTFLAMQRFWELPHRRRHQ